MILEILSSFNLALVLFCFILLEVTRRLTNYRNEQKHDVKWLNGPMSRFGGGLQLALIGATRTFNETVQELGVRYGDICGVWGSPSNYFVFVTGAEVAKKILKHEGFEGKFPQSSWDTLLYRKPNLGILHSFGSTSIELRSRSIAKLRKFGYGHPNFNGRLRTLVEETVKIWEINCTKNYGLLTIDEHAFMPEMCDMIWNILLGTSFPGSATEFNQLSTSMFISLNAKLKQFVLLYAYKFLRFIPGLTMYQNTKEVWTTTEHLLKRIIHQRKVLGRYKEIQENFIDSFLYDIDAKVHPDVTGVNTITYTLILDQIQNTNSKEQLLWVLNDLELVGITGLAAHSLQWALLFLCLNRQVMNKIVQEIDDVLGNEKLPELSDRSRMPYTESVILESIRLGSVVQYATRSNINDVTFDGFFVPKETLVMVSTDCLRRDPLIWDDPDTFRPERFFAEATNTLVNVEKLNAFGFKRPCLGENLVRPVNFMFLTTLLQKFTIEFSSKTTATGLPSIKSAGGIIGHPATFYVNVTRRHQQHDGEQIM